MKKLNAFILIAVVTMMSGIYSPAMAQNTPDTRANTEAYDDDDDANYGWIGLLGLIGLAGLVRRPKEVHDARTASAPKYTS